MTDPAQSTGPQSKHSNYAIFRRGRMLRYEFQSFPYRIMAVRCVAVLALLFSISGCSSLWPGKSEENKDQRLNELLKVPEPPELVREAAIPRGLNAIHVEGVAAVNGLPGTGGPADPSVFRDQLLEEMKRHDIVDPNQFLELPETALVRVDAIIPAGARRGDPLDLRVLSPARSKVSNLHSGWLMDTRLRHQQMLQNAIRQSEVMVIGTGPVVTRSDIHGGSDEAHQTEGFVIGGGRVQIERKLGLILRPEYQHVKMAVRLADAINRRFYFFDGTTRRGIAKATEDDYIEVEVHPRYRGQEARLMTIVGSIGVKPESSDTQQRLVELSKRLREPATAADAANQLEALGESAIPTLADANQVSNPELRFYAAEALAYLDRTEAIEPLEAAIKSEPAFRYSGLLALEGLQQHLALDALRRLMDESSLETRYGAFRSLRRRDDGKRVLNGKTIGDSFRLYKIASQASGAIVVSTIETPEIVLFGSTGTIDIPEFMFGSDGILLKPEPESPGQIRISRFQVGQSDKRAVVPNNVESVIAGVAAVGGGYGDVIAVLRKAKEAGYLKQQLALDPLPQSQRTYFRDSEETEDTVAVSP